MDFWVLVGLHQCLNLPTHGSFTIVLYLRIGWWLIVVLSFQLTQQHTNFRLCKRKYMALAVDIEFRLHLGYCISIYNLIHWLFRCDLDINHWLNHLCSCRWLKISVNHGIARMFASSQMCQPFNLSDYFGTLFSSHTCWQKSI